MSNSSSPQNTPEYLEELMAGYVLNTLSIEEIEELEHYIRENPKLSQQIDELQELMGLIAYAAPSITAPPLLRTKILQATQTKGSSASSSNITKLSSRSWRKVVLAVGAIATLALGVDNYLLRQRLSVMEATIDVIQGSATRGFALKGTQVSHIASGSVVLDLENGKAVIALQELPPLPKNESYYLWAFTKKKKILCGQFNTTASGQLIHEVPIPIQEYDSPVLLMQISKGSTDHPAHLDQQPPVMTSES